MKAFAFLLAGFFLLLPLTPTFTQGAADDLSAADIFAKVVDHYDPDGVWEQFSGSLHMHTIGPDWISEEDLTLNNQKAYYRTIRYAPENTYARGTRSGKVFYEIDGVETPADRVPTTLQAAPNNLNEETTWAMREHHILHFSMPLGLRAAGAEPLPEVTTEKLFGVECLAIRFAELPDNHEAGFYHDSPLTLYVDPANDYRLHAAHVESEMWPGGILMQFAGELTVDGLTIPARKIYFAAADRSFQLIDVFTTDTRFD